MGGVIAILNESILTSEHIALNAAFTKRSDMNIPARYTTPEAELAAALDSCALTDLSWLRAELIAGPASQEFSSLVFANPAFAVGDCQPSALLAGDGSLVNVAYTIRTGDTELLCLSSPERFEIMEGWLDFLVAQPHADVTHFDCKVSEVTSQLTPLLLTGPRASELLSDYLAPHTSLPEPHHIAQLSLDKILTIVVSPAPNTYALLVPPAYAQVLWRSFLSFTYVEPMGIEAFEQWLPIRATWLEALQSTERIEPDVSHLVADKLVRAGDGFVGARALNLH